MSFHKSDPAFIKLFVAGFHKYNIDHLTGQELLNSWTLFVEYMKKNNEYLPDSPSIKAAKEFYKHQNPTSKYWTESKESRLKTLKPWLTDAYSSRLTIIKKEKQNTEDISMDFEDELVFPPKINTYNNSSNNNNSNINNNNRHQNHSLNLSPDSQTKIISISSSLSPTMDQNNKEKSIITIKRKRRKYGKREFDSETESDEMLNDFDLQFKSGPSSQNYIQQTQNKRKQEEAQISYSRNEEKLRAIRSNTGKIVSDLIQSAIPSIINNTQITEIIEQEKNFRTKQQKYNEAIIKNLKKFKQSTERYFGIIDAKLDKLLKPEKRTNRPAKRKRMDIEYDFEEELF